jgi:hypothetical protein
LFRDELRIVLTPEQVLLARIGRSIGWRGLGRRVLEKQVLSCAAHAAGEGQGSAPAQWGAALQAVEAALAGKAGRKACATVILSNHFMRYVLLPWSDVPATEEEEMAYARHTFRQAYGEAAEGWELRLSPGRIGRPQLASAVDKRLLEALRSLFGRAGIVLVSIQPHLMAAYNACHSSLEGRSAWLALVEPGSLCLALLRQGGWESVRSMRMDGDGRVALPLMLEREANLAESAAAVNEVMLWAPWLAGAQLPASRRWKFRKLQPRLPAGIAPVSDPRFAIALSGCA